MVVTISEPHSKCIVKHKHTDKNLDLDGLLLSKQTPKETWTQNPGSECVTLLTRDGSFQGWFSGANGIRCKDKKIISLWFW